MTGAVTGEGIVCEATTATSAAKCAFELQLPQLTMARVGVTPDDHWVPRTQQLQQCY